MRTLLKVVAVLAILLLAGCQNETAFTARRVDERGNVVSLTPVGPSILLTTTGASAALGYATGTITLVAGDSTVVGSGTDWAAEETASRMEAGMALIVGGDYRHPLIIDSITDGTNLEIKGYPPSHLIGAGKSYTTALAPGVEYILTPDGNCYFLAGPSTVTAVDGASQYLGMNQSWAISPAAKNLFVAVIPVGGAGTVILKITPCE